MSQITVIGSSQDVSEEVLHMAELVGEEIAKRGAVLVCGGKTGVMEAACRGAKKHNGVTVGILPESSDEANQYVDVKLPTGLGFGRNILVAKSSESVIAICGALGTLNELCLAAEFGKKIILLKGTGGIVDEFENIMKIPGVMEKAAKRGGRIVTADTPEQAVKMALEK